jgi:signal transduction histidine kinase
MLSHQKNDYADLRGQPAVKYVTNRKAAYYWTLGLVVGFVVLDLRLPLGVATGVPYAVAVMASLRTSNQRFIVGVTVLTGLLTLLGLALSPDGGETSKVISNRTLAIFVIIGAGAFAIYALNARKNFTRQAVLIEQARRRRVQEANVQLIRASEARNDFLGQISHELRTPLTSLTTFAHILDSKAGTLPVERVKAHSEVISRSARRLEVLIEDLLDVSGAETGEFKLDLAIVDLPEIISPAAEDFAAQARSRDQEIMVDRDITNGHKYHALADPVRLSQVVTNLVSNASKYSWPGSDITVFCALENGRYIVKISDRCEGIKREDLQKIFTPFFRADNVNVRSVPGAGLGLTIARSIVELHDGNMSVESELEVGTTFSFTIPAFPNG